MSSEAIAWAWRRLDAKPNHKYVLLALAEHAHTDGTNAYPSVSRLSKMTGYSERQIIRVLAEMVDAGLIFVARPGGWSADGVGQATSYTLTMFKSTGGGGDKMSGGGGDRLSEGGVTDCPKGGDKMSPQPRTRTKNLEPRTTTPAEASPSSAAVDPVKVAAREITEGWWESFDPRPTSGTFTGYVKVIERLLAAGWPVEAVAAATRDVGRTMTVARMEMTLAKQRGRTVSYTADPDAPAAVEINPATW